MSLRERGKSPGPIVHARGSLIAVHNLVTDVREAIQHQVLQVVSGTPTSAMPTLGKPSVVASGRRAMALGRQAMASGRRPAKVAPLERWRRKGRQRQQGYSAQKKTSKDSKVFNGWFYIALFDCYGMPKRLQNASQHLKRKCQFLIAWDGIWWTMSHLGRHHSLRRTASRMGADFNSPPKKWPGWDHEQSQHQRTPRSLRLLVVWSCLYYVPVPRITLPLLCYCMLL